MQAQNNSITLNFPGVESIITSRKLPHKASFIPVSTLPILGGRTPGVSNRCTMGRSHTWGQWGLELYEIRLGKDIILCFKLTWILVRTALVIPGSPPTRDARPEESMCKGELTLDFQFCTHKRISKIGSKNVYLYAPFFKKVLLNELIRDDFPTLGTPITIRQ